MKKSSFLSRALTVGLVVLLVIATGVMLPRSTSGATEVTTGAAAEGEDTPTAAATNLSEQVGALLRDLAEIRVALKSAEGEERELLIDRAIRSREALLDTLPDLIDELSRLRAAKVDTAALDDQARGYLDQTLAILRQSLATRKRRIREYRGRVDEASPEAQLEIDSELVRQNRHWDETLGDILSVAEMKQELGADASKDFRFLDAELEESAELRAGQLRIVTRRLDNATEDSANLQGDAASAAEEKIAELKRQSERIAASLTVVLGLMDKRDLDTGEGRRLLVEATGEFTNGGLDAGVLASLVRDWVGDGVAWARDNGPRTLVRIVLFLAILLVFRVLASVARGLVEKAVARSATRFSKLLREFFVTMTYRGVLLFGVLVAMSQLGIEIGPLLAGLGVAGFIVGFALQDTLSNFASGLMILAYRPFDVGDIIQAAGVSGIVDQLTLVSTTIRTFDNQRSIVPNTKIWGDVIVNVTAEKIRRVDLLFGIGYGDDIEKAQSVLEDIVSSHELVLKEPAPTIRLHALNESSVDFVVRPWTQTKDYWGVYWDLTREVKRRFDAEGISIPFPQRDVHLIAEPGE